jgi:hypothetical protein
VHVAGHAYCGAMIICRGQRLFVLMLALFWGLGMGFSNVQASQIAAMQATGMRMNMPAECQFCGDDGERMSVVACIYICVSSGTAVQPIIEVAVDFLNTRVGGSSIVLAGSRTGRPDPYPPKP